MLSIEIETLDESAIDTTGLCFVKIDVEGFEQQVIRGGSNTDGAIRTGAQAFLKGLAAAGIKAF